VQKRISGIIERLYQYWQPHLVDEEEIAFYRAAILEADGSALEMACGGGRLLLRFLKEGFPVEGVDSSKEMLDILRSHAAKLGCNPTLYCQKIEDLHIQKIYRLLYISLGSFQFISDEYGIKIALAKYCELLEKGGKLIIPLFIPWTDRSYENPNWRIVSDMNVKSRNCRLVRRELCTHDPVEQIIEARLRYETWQKKDLLEMTEKSIRIRWYAKGEFIALLKEAGFSQVEMLRSYGKEATPRPDFMLFIAQK
jgi:SAM-dependent methyltransferase